MLKVMVFCHLQEQFNKKYGKKLIDTATKTGKTSSKRVVQKTAEATRD